MKATYVDKRDDGTSVIRTIHMGRTRIKTALTELTRGDIKGELKRVMPTHLANRDEIDFLQRYHRGDQPEVMKREKVVREDVDNRIIINYAKSATRDIVGYFLGKPIRFVARDIEQSGAVKDFNAFLTYENKEKGDREIANSQSICGTAYRGCFPDPFDDGTPPFTLATLDAKETFCVYPSDPSMTDALYAVCYYTERKDDDTYIDHYTIYTSKKRFTFTVPYTAGTPDYDSMSKVNEKAHIIGHVPIVEYPNNEWCMGDWETAVSILDAINITASDSVNDVVQRVQSILLAVGVDLSDPAVWKQVKDEKLLNITELPQGLNIDARYLDNQLDALGVANLRDYLESSLRVVLGVPDRKTRGGGGGDTGDAVFMRDGWLDIDLVASNKEPFTIAAERKLIEIALAITNVRTKPFIRWPWSKDIQKLNAIDVDIKFSRSKTANLQVKAQAFMNLVGTKKIAPVDALEMVDLTTDPQDVTVRGDEYWKAEAEAALKVQQQIEASKTDNTDSRASAPDSQQDGGANS